MAPYKILKQGYMEKEPPLSKRGLRKKVIRYWFVLVEDNKQVALVYFKNEDQYIARHQNEGFIRIDEAESISVIGEFMGRKHAFVIKTPKGPYTLVPQSRYDLHEWLFTLHNSLEVFKKRRPSSHQRQQGPRQRSNTSDNTASRPQQATQTRTPPLTPSRRAPPPPAHSSSTEPRRKPSHLPPVKKKPTRPAPVPPQKAQNGEHALSAQGASPNVDSEPQPFSYLVNDILSQESYADLESGRHGIMDLDISHVDHDQRHSSQDNQPHPFDHGPYPYDHDHVSSPHEDQPHPLNHDPPAHQPSVDQGVSPTHQRSCSDTVLVMMHQNSNSLPDLFQCDEASSSPDDDSQDNNEEPSNFDNEAHTSSSMSPNSVHFQPRHTRHLSLTGGLEGFKKKKVTRRLGSFKLRSRSPPELPPPPPPELNGAEPASLNPAGPQGSTPNEAHLSVKTQNETKSMRIGFSTVMNTIHNIDQELEEMDEILSPKPTFPAPLRQSTSERLTINYVVQSPSPVPEHPEMEQHEVDYDANFDEDEWLCDAPPDFVGSELTDEDGGQSKGSDFGPSSKIIEDQVRQEILASPENAPVQVIAETTQVKGQRKVMFREEVEAIPITYEPCADNMNSEPDEELLSSVAEIKKRLFGAREEQVARFKKDEMIPKYAYPEKLTFELEQYSHEEEAPNVNNNNSGGECAHAEESTVPHVEKRTLLQEEETVPQEDYTPRPVVRNAYEDPWEYSSTSTFKVFRNSKPKKTPVAQKDPTPPPVAPKPTPPTLKENTPPPTTMAAVSQDQTTLKENTPPPTTMAAVSQDRTTLKENTPPPTTTAAVSQDRTTLKENTPPPTTMAAVAQDRNAYSAESKKYGGGGGDLLSSISHTLQERSKYGSDSFLNSFDSNSLTKTKTGGNFSSKGELEKIRAAHRREPPPPPVSQSVSPPGLKEYNGQMASPPTASFGGPRMSSSVDGLSRGNRSNIQITYDKNTQSHVYRSLV